MSAPSELSFLPDDYLEQKAQRRNNVIFALLFVVVMCGVGGAFTLSDRATKQVFEEGALVDEQYIAQARLIQQARQMHDKQKRMAQQAELTASLLEKVQRSYLLAELTNSLPAGMSLLDLELSSRPRVKASSEAPKTAYEQKRAAKGAAAGTGVPPLAEPKLYEVTLAITGVAATDVQVAQYLNKLSRSPLFREANLVISEEQKQDDQLFRKFKIEAVVHPDAEVRPSDVKKASAVKEVPQGAEGNKPADASEKKSVLGGMFKKLLAGNNGSEQ
jgi:Tfp pilus assembly protein PilN